MPKTPAKSGDRDFESDEELGIGKDDVANILNNPEFAKLIDAAVEARLAQAGGSVPSPAANTPEFAGLLAAVERMFQLQAIQQPGYVKPISSEEMERRAAGKVEMEALLREFQTKGTPPRYILGDKFYAGDVLYSEGQEIHTYLPPAESFQPVNDPAYRVHAAMMQWIGGATLPIGEQVEAAMQATKQQIPLVGSSAPNLAPSPVEVVVGAPRHDVRPPRVAGTSVPETHGVSLPSMPSTAPMPTGPVFINP